MQNINKNNYFLCNGIETASIAGASQCPIELFLPPAQIAGKVLCMQLILGNIHLLQEEIYKVLDWERISGQNECSLEENFKF